MTEFAILEEAKKEKRTVAIGLERVTDNIVKSIKKAGKYVDIITVGKAVNGIKNIEGDSHTLVQLLKDKKVDGIVRGNFDAVKMYEAFRDLFNVSFISQIQLFLLNGVRSIDEEKKGLFTIVPVSFSNERTIEDKIRTINLSIELFRSLKIDPKLGILAKGKPEDRSEGIAEINKSLDEADYLVDFYKKRGIWAKHFNHQIEYALLESNIIVAPDSGAGNLAAHCLIYLGTCESLGGIAANLKDYIYVQGSEAQQDFYNNIMLAAGIANSTLKFNL